MFPQTVIRGILEKSHVSRKVPRVLLGLDMGKVEVTKSGTRTVLSRESTLLISLAVWASCTVVLELFCLSSELFLYRECCYVG